MGGEVRPFPRVVDLYDDDELRVVGGEQRGERRGVLARRVAATHDAPRRTGLGSDLERGEGSFLAGATLRRAVQQLPQPPGDVGSHRPAHRLGPVPVEHAAAGGGAADLPDERRLEQDAVVGDGPVRGRELQRRDRELVADGEARGAGPRPLRRRAQPTRRLGRELDARRRTEAEVAQHAVLLRRLEALRELHQRDVARNADRVGERERRQRLLVHNGAVEQLPAAALSRHPLAGQHAMQREQPRGSKDLRDRAGLERVGEGARPRRAVAPARGDREQLARRRIEHHDVAAVGVHAAQRLVERALGNLLELGVERQHDVVPGQGPGDDPRGRDVLAAGAVLQHHRRARHTRHETVERTLEPRRAAAVVVDAADHRPGKPRRRIEPVQDRLQVHAPQRADRLDGRGPVRAAEVGVALPQRSSHLGGGHAQGARDRERVARGILELVGGDTDVIRLLRDGDGGAAAIAQRAAAGGEHHLLGASGGGQGRPAMPLHHLDLGRPPQQHQEGEEHDADNRLEPDERARHG